ncbi:cop9 signalosome complex subunit 6 [Anaeramoeba flamelloides]|uniref:Cop9 signalosome complex subunit 6 n=1 Tax=Anaeramoeba flamelloides TaxID=1746091 RepID=A0ABQ8Z213_9EUKA|nr:cop9 signalosome complex subunit 6 [Anaeramoeba flamelloides]
MSFLALKEYKPIVIHPSAVFGILEHFARRTDKRVVGALLGVVKKMVVNGKRCEVFEINSTVPIPFAKGSEKKSKEKEKEKEKEFDDEIENDDEDKKLLKEEEENTLDLEFLGKLGKIMPYDNKDDILGWYATGDKPQFLREFITRKVTNNQNPIHLLTKLDLQSVNEKVKLEAYLVQPIIIERKLYSCSWKRLELHHSSRPYESKCLMELRFDHTNDKFTDNTQIAIYLLHGLLNMISILKERIKKISSGETNIDQRNISYVVTLKESLKELFQNEDIFLNKNKGIKSFSSDLRDILMIKHLLDQTKNQIEISDNIERL